MESKYKMRLMNMEVTTTCPLGCAQCYCTLNTGKDMPIQVAKYWIDQAKINGIETINLSGGETLCYPNLYEVISYATAYGIKTNIAISGYGFDKRVYERLVIAGVSGIFVSLNAPTEKIDQISRKGYSSAISALALLKQVGYKNTSINWVMQASNSDYFEDLIKFAEEYEVKQVVVIRLKPDSMGLLQANPTKTQMRRVSSFIRSYSGPISILVESCFSEMAALTQDMGWIGNFNSQSTKGCLAGREHMSVSVDGLLSPCRHLDYFEKWDTLEEYWNNSKILQKIRTLEDCKREPCISCKFCNYCRHCLSINSKLNRDLYIGNEFCPLANEYKNEVKIATSTE